MIAMQVARIIADFVLFLDLTDDDVLDPDASVEMAEWLGARLKGFDMSFLRELADAFGVVAAEYNGEAQNIVRDIPYSFYLEDELAGDDPVKLAEIDAVRNAKG